MGKQYRKQLTFQSGELSPKFLGRSDDPIYEQGLGFAHNVYIDKRGGAFKRRGAEHITSIDGNNGRLFTLQVNKTKYYKIVITNGKMVIVAPGAQLSGNNVVQNPDFQNGSVSWTPTEMPAGLSRVIFDSEQVSLLPTQIDRDLVSDGNFDTNPHAEWTVREVGAGSSVTFANDECILVPGTDPLDHAGIAQQQTTDRPGEPHQFVMEGNLSAGDLHIQIGETEGGSEYHDGVVHTGSGFEFTPVASPFWITMDCLEPNIQVVLRNIKVIEPTVKIAKIEQQLTILAANLAHEHTIVVSKDGASRMRVMLGTTAGAGDLLDQDVITHELKEAFHPTTGDVFLTILADGDNTAGGVVSFVGAARTDQVAASPIGIEMVAPWNNAQMREIHFVELPAGDAMYFLHPNVQPQKLVYNRKTDTFTDLAAVTFTDGPAVWKDHNWPATGTFFQGRLWLAATPDQGHTLWASRSGDYDNFKTDGASPTDASALEFPLAKFGRIEWVLGTKKLLIGAENGEHIVTSEGPVVTNADHSIKLESTYGSNDVQAVQVAEKVFYVTPDGRKLRAMSFDWQEDNWLSHDLTFASEHITESGIRDAVWVQNPNNLFVVVLNNGDMATLTYDRTGKTVGWTRYRVPHLHVIDIATGLVNGVSELVIIGQRTSGKIDVELFSENAQYLDSYIGSFNQTAISVVDGLGHLENRAVRALVDGAVEPETVVHNGHIELVNPGHEIYVGMPYSGLITTLPPDVPQSQIRSFVKRWNKVWGLLMDSKQPLINGVRPPDRTPSSPMDHTEPDQSGQLVTVNLGWDEYGLVTIEQDLPVAMNLLAIYGELNAETL